jgi:hypothetical protein
MFIEKEKKNQNYIFKRTKTKGDVSMPTETKAAKRDLWVGNSRTRKGTTRRKDSPLHVRSN